MNPDVDQFLKKTKQWKSEIETLRDVLLKADLEESLKWGKPCYSFNEANIAIIQPFKGCLGMMFFKGTLLKDPKGILVDNGPNSQAARRIEFHTVEEIKKLASTVKAYIKEAISLEKSGQKVEFKKKPESMPPELKQALAKNPKLKTAFSSLTPGRQRAYILYFAGAKQSVTRQSRIEKCLARILAGKGLND